jgi:two-component system, NarL family, invasion response regulator UvrY
MKLDPSSVLKIAVVDDHALFRRGLINLILSFGSAYEIVFECSNGKEFLVELQKHPDLQIAIIDMNMPDMNGFETATELQKIRPEIKILIITMLEEEQTLIKMLKNGVRGYLTKDVEPEELKNALDTIASKGFYYSDHLTGKLINALKSPNGNGNKEETLNDRELKFLHLACSEYTYKEIADMMFLSVKTIDGYRNSLFEKLQVKSRVGLVLYAIKNNLVKL